MTKYETVVDTSVRNSSHSLIVEMVEPGMTVLDVGCATGYLADALNARGCTVSGMEIDPEAAEIARPKLDALVVGDLEATPIATAFADQTFDRVIFGDVLEHLRDPAAVLRSAVDVLSAEGEVVISVPNVAHGSLRLALLLGRWDYRDLGLLDRTHLHFFTYQSLGALLRNAGLELVQAFSTVLDPLGTEVEMDDEIVPGDMVEWVRHQPHALDYQFVVRARRATAAGEDAVPPDVVPALAYKEVRAEDAHTRRASEIAEERHRALVLRDALIGLQASVGRADSEIRGLRADVARLEAENVHVHAELAGVAEDRARMRASATWRAGALMTAPLRVLKRAAR